MQRVALSFVANPVWYQGLMFNEFVSALDGKQQEKILLGREPRGEKPEAVIQKRKTDLPGFGHANVPSSSRLVISQSPVPSK